ncbi:porin [Paraburkholderia terrae]
MGIGLKELVLRTYGLLSLWRSSRYSIDNAQPIPANSSGQTLARLKILCKYKNIIVQYFVLHYSPVRWLAVNRHRPAAKLHKAAPRSDSGHVRTTALFKLDKGFTMMKSRTRADKGRGLSPTLTAGMTGALMAFASAASAQSSVTLYGLVDAGMSFNSNAGGKHQVAMTSGNMNGARWGLTGIEDLGGGLRAIFQLEAGYSVTNGTIGQNGTEFGRQAYVGLTNQYGTATLGRQYSDVSMKVGPFQASNWAAGGAAYGAHVGDIDNLDSSWRINNAVKFQSVDYNGLTFGGLYSFGGQAGNFTKNNIYDLDVTYANGPFSAAVAYLYAKNPNFSFYGNRANDSTTGVNITSPAVAGYAAAGSQQIVTAGAAYKVGAATLGMVYSNVKFNSLGVTAVAGLNPTARAYRGSATFNIGEVSVKYYVTPSLLLGVAYNYTRDSGATGDSGAHYNQYDLGAIYSLSKRTALYLVGLYQTASGTNSLGNKAVAAINQATASSTNHQFVATLGINHKF